MRKLASGLMGLTALALITLPARAQKEADVQEVIQEFQKKDPGMAAWFKDAYGYAVFPNVGKGGLVVGGAHGDGLVYEQGKLIGKTSLTAVTFGLQAGGQAFQEVIFFKDKAALDNFTRGNFEFQGGVSAVALKEGVSKTLAYDKGVAVMSAVKGGLMAEASVGGQKFKYEPVKKESP
jgi:lipid-binding SYLF domain-containing protein